MLNKKLLTEFSETFLGYGNIKAPVWFIGMEPGAPDSVELVEKFFDVWVMRGSLAIDDVRESHLEIDKDHYSGFFLGNIKYQKTWGGLIKFLFALTGKKDFSIDDVKKYQSEKLGRKHSDHCLIELLPLPSPNNTANKWEKLYSNFINTRKEYETTYLPRRVSKINSLIKSCKPKIIIFYGFKYKSCFEQISGVDFELTRITEDKKLFYKKVDKILYMLIPQPSQGVSDKYLARVGEIAKQNID